MGLTIDYFNSLTAAEFNNILQGYNKKVLRDYRTGWEQTRVIVYYNYLMTPTKGSKKDIGTIFPLLWDSEHPEIVNEIMTNKASADFWANVDKMHSRENKTGTPEKED